MASTLTQIQLQKDTSADSRSHSLGACSRSSTGSLVLLGRRGLCEGALEVKPQDTPSSASCSSALANHHDERKAATKGLAKDKRTSSLRNRTFQEPVETKCQQTAMSPQAASACGQEVLDKDDSPEDDEEDERSTEIGVRSDDSEDSFVEVDDAIVPTVLLIFDWDDTLCPSSWLKHFKLLPAKGSHHCFAPSQKQREQLCLVAERAAELLRRAKTLGEVVIITSAQQGWVELSCKKFLPDLWPEVAAIRIVSARSTFERTVKSPSGWKVHAFREEMHRCFGEHALFDSHPLHSVMSIGDALDERYALLTVCGPVKGCFAKSVKLIDSPDPVELQEQHTLLTNSLERFAKLEGDIDLSLKGN